MTITNAMRSIITTALVLFLADIGLGYAGNLHNVVIISIDALHPNALREADIPTLRQLVESGTYTLKGRSTDPPKTLIAHTAMFTGMSPEKNGKTDNSWMPGQGAIEKPTIFNSAKSNKYQTGYFYSKQKLGYLVNDAIDVHRLSRDNAIDLAEAFIKTPGSHFLFLHVSGLDQVGPEYGWMSPEYLEELSFIDDYLSSLVELIKDKQQYLIIITSDHAGHDKIHGSQDPEDYRLPLIICSDAVSVERYKNISFSVVGLKKIIENLLEKGVF